MLPCIILFGVSLFTDNPHFFSTQPKQKSHQKLPDHNTVRLVPPIPEHSEIKSMFFCVQTDCGTFPEQSTEWRVLMTHDYTKGTTSDETKKGNDVTTLLDDDESIISEPHNWRLTFNHKIGTAKLSWQPLQPLDDPDFSTIPL